MSRFELDRELFAVSRRNGVRAFAQRRLRGRVLLPALTPILSLLLPFLVLAIRFDVPHGIQAQALGKLESVRVIAAEAVAGLSRDSDGARRQAAAILASDLAIGFHKLLCPLFRDCGDEATLAPPSMVAGLVPAVPIAPAAQASATTTVVQYVTQPVIERKGVTEATFNAKLSLLKGDLLAQIAHMGAASGQSAASADAFVSRDLFDTQVDAIYDSMDSGSPSIDTISGATISNSTITGGTIAATSISGTITNVLDSLSGTITLLTGNELTYTRATTTTFAITSLATGAGAYLAVNPDGSVIATTTPTGSSASSTLLSDTNIWSGLQAFSSTGTTTFGGGIQAPALNITSTSASSTFARGINLTGGCFAVNGTCLASSGGGSTASSTLLADTNAWSGGNMFANATTSNLHITSIISGLLGTDANGRVVSTTTISTGLLAGSLGTVNGTTFNRGDSITVTAASSTLISDRNSFSALNTFANATTTLLSGASAWFTSLIGNLTGNVTGNASTATALQTARNINNAVFDGTGDITITAASSTLLANTNMWTGGNIFTNATTTNLHLTSLTNSLLATDATGRVFATTTPTATTFFATGNSNASQFPYASSTALTVSGTSYLTNLSSALLSTNASGQIVGTTTIGAGYVSGGLGTINGTNFNRGDSITVTAASSTLLADANTWTGTHSFAAITVTNGTFNATTTGDGSAFAFTPPGFGGTWLANNQFSSSYASTHAGSARTTLNVARVADGSGTNGPATADFGALITAQKANYLSSSVEGEVDGLYIVTTQGNKGDSAGINIGASKIYGGADPTGSVLGLEASTRWLNSSNNVLMDVHSLVGFGEGVGGQSTATGYGFYAENQGGSVPGSTAQLQPFAAYYGGSYNAYGNSTSTYPIFSNLLVGAGSRSASDIYFKITGGQTQAGDIVIGSATSMAPNGTATQSGGIQWTMKNVSGDWRLYANDSTTALQTIKQTGNVGIGTTTPGGWLHLYRSYPDLWMTHTAANIAGGGLWRQGTSGTGSSGFYYFQVNTAAAGDFSTSVVPLAMTMSGVGFGTTSPWRTLSVTGTVGFDGLTGATGAGSLCLSSSREVVYNSGSDACLPSLRDTKRDIDPLTVNALAQVLALRPVSFIYNESDGRTRYGFIAEDTAAVDPHLATYNASGALSGIDDRSILAIVVKAIQELSTQIAALFESDEQQNADIAELKAEITALKAEREAGSDSPILSGDHAEQGGTGPADDTATSTSAALDSPSIVPADASDELGREATPGLLEEPEQASEILEEPEDEAHVSTP